jgi:pilus assembly protein CpaB
MLKGKTPLIIAVVLGVVAAFMAWRQLKMRELEVTRGWQLQNVMVAAAEVRPGEFLSKDNVIADKMPRKFVYESVLVPADMEYALGREVVVPIKRGEPIHWYQLKGVRTLERLSKAVRKLARAISINVAERSAVGMWVRPNDHVDVLGIFRDPQTNTMVSITLLEDIIVLATGQTNTNTQGLRADKNYSTVTLLASPEEAETIVLAQELGSLYLSLRNPEDNSVFNSKDYLKTTIQTLLSGERARELRDKRRRTFQQQIKVIRGIRDEALGGGKAKQR